MSTHIYKLLHKSGFKQKLAQKRFVNTAFANEDGIGQNSMIVVPVHFSTEHKDLLKYTKLLLENGYIILTLQR